MKFLLGLFASMMAVTPLLADPTDNGISPIYEVSPIGWVRKSNGKTIIEVDKKYQPALLGVEELNAIWVLYWFDRNDFPEKREILQVHPRRNPQNPLRGVFATQALWIRHKPDTTKI